MTRLLELGVIRDVTRNESFAGSRHLIYQNTGILPPCADGNTEEEIRVNRYLYAEEEI